MAIIGFIFLTVLLVFFTLGWGFVFLFDGAFGGRRDVPVYVMWFVLAVVIYGWVKLVEYLPFSVVMN